MCDGGVDLVGGVVEVFEVVDFVDDDDWVVFLDVGVVKGLV